MAYAKRYAAGFTDNDNSKPVDAQALNAIETALLELYQTVPSTNFVPVWDGAKFTPQKITASQISATAAIAKSQLAALGIVDADISAGAAISYSKLALAGQILNADLAGSIAASKLLNYPTDGTKALFGDGTWKTAGPTYYRKATSKTVTNTVADTDLLNGEITVGANVIGATGVLRLTAWGDWLNNSGGATDLPRFKLKLGAGPTTVIDTGVPIGAAVQGASATQFGWRIAVEIVNANATNAQAIHFLAHIAYLNNGTAYNPPAFTTGEGGWYVPQTTAGAQRGTTGSGFNTSALDTTAAMAVQLTVINPTATATCSTKLYGAIVEVF